MVAENTFGIAKLGAGVAIAASELQFAKRPTKLALKPRGLPLRTMTNSEAPGSTDSLHRLVLCLVSQVADLKQEVRGLRDILASQQLRLDEIARGCGPEISVRRCPPSPGKPLAGIVNFLTSQYPDTINQVLKVTASSIYTDRDIPKYAATFGTSQFFLSKSISDPQQWLSYDFGGMRVQLTHYTLRSQPSYDAYGQHTLKSWRLSGSIDGEVWELLHEKQPNQDLREWNTICTYDIDDSKRGRKFRHVRLTMTGTDHAGGNYLGVGALELFGTLTCDGEF